MSSSWKPEIKAVIRKEIRSEMRSKSALYTTFMLSGVTVFTLAFAFYGRELTSEAASGMLWAALLFAGVGSLTRSFVAEEEQGTGDLLRMWGNPSSIYWGKAAYALMQMIVTSLFVAVLFLTLTGVRVTDYLLLAAGLAGGSLALASMITLVSALISRGNNRGALAGVVAMPLLIPLVALGVSSSRNALDGFSINTGWLSCAGVWLYAIVVLAMAPYQFAAVWSEK